jgi:hypothetical protein
MKKILLLLVLFGLLYSANAQNWFTNNPVWNDDLYNSAGWGYEKYFVQKDTVVNGIPCKKIIADAVLGSFWDTTQYSQTASYLYEQNNVVFMFLGPNVNTFDTLYNFGASMGDKWGINGACYNDSLPYIEVLDIGFSNINNSNLKWLYVQYHNMAWGDDVSTDTIYDKMGSIYAGLLLQGLGCQFDYTHFCSYRDDSIGLYPSNAQYCDTAFATTVPSLSSDIEIKIFPNPVHDFLRFSNVFNQKGKLEIIDALGKIVLSQNSILSIINVSELEDGMYSIIIRDVTTSKATHFVKM